MKDIQRLLNIISRYKSSNSEFHKIRENEDLNIIISINDVAAIENLIKGYRELELNDKEKEIINAYRNLIQKTGSESWIICDPNTMWSEYFIPKSKIKEKIEKLEKEKRELCEDGDEDVFGYTLMLIENQKEILQELMEDK